MPALDFVLVAIFTVLSIVILAYPHKIADLAWFEIAFGKELDSDGLLGFMRALTSKSSNQPVIFEIAATSETVCYRIGSSQAQLSNIRSLLNSFCPDLTVKPRNHNDLNLTASFNIRLDTYSRALSFDQAENATKSILSEFKSLPKDDVVLIQLILGKRLKPTAVFNKSDVLPDNNILQSVSKLLLGNNRQIDSEEKKALRLKIKDPGFRAICRIGINAKDKKLTRIVGNHILGAIRVLEGPGVRLKLRRDFKAGISKVKPPIFWPLKLNVNEALAFLFYPIGDGSYPLINRGRSKLLPPSKSIPSSGRIIGTSTYPSDIRPLGLSEKDSLVHMHVLGPTGVGKSTLLLNLIVQDIKANRGVIVIDPKGDLVTDIAKRIPGNRTNDVIIINPADNHLPVGLNPLKTDTNDNKELIADQVLAIFHELYAENWGPRTQDILHASLLTLIGLPDTTLCSIPVLLSSPNYRKQVTSNLKDNIGLKSFWSWYESISNAERNQAIAPVMNKVRPFLMRKSIRAVLGQANPKFRISNAIENKQIVLVSLAKGLLGKETSSLLGSLIVSQIWNATLSRVSIPIEKRHPIICYFDEFQDYIHLPTDFSDVLAQARALGLGLTLAHQHLGQLTPALRQAVLSNARNRVCFQLNADDATIIAKSTDNLKSEDFINLSRFEIYANLISNNQVSGFVSGKTMEPTPVTSDPNEIFELSRNRYGKDTFEIEQEIANLGSINLNVQETTIGRKKRSNQ